MCVKFDRKEAVNAACFESVNSHLKKNKKNKVSEQGKSLVRTCKATWRVLHAGVKAYARVYFVKGRCRQTSSTQIRFTHNCFYLSA